MRRKILGVAGATAAMLAGVACTPQQAAQISAELLSRDDAGPEVDVVELPHESHPVYGWEVRGCTLLLTNMGETSFDYEAWYGPHQSPLTVWEVISTDPYQSRAPHLEPGEVVRINLEEVEGSNEAFPDHDVATVFLNGGAALHAYVRSC
jgi:hypothetical protein